MLRLLDLLPQPILGIRQSLKNSTSVPSGMEYPFMYVCIVSMFAPPLCLWEKLYPGLSQHSLKTCRASIVTVTTSSCFVTEQSSDWVAKRMESR